MERVPDDAIAVELSPAEATTIDAAVRQYEPYWSPSLSQSAVFQELTDTNAQIASVLAKLRVATALER